MQSIPSNIVLNSHQNSSNNGNLVGIMSQSNTAQITTNGSSANGGGGGGVTTEQCQGCLSYIQDRYYLQVMDKAWHLNCLRCVECKTSLDSQQTCFARDGLIYCKDDYFKCFPRPRKCHGCCQSIGPNELVMRARNLIFHLSCFKCLVCDRQLNTGDEFGLGKDGLVYCRMHYFYHIQQQQPQSMEHLHQINHQPHQQQHIQHQPFNSFYVDQNNQYSATNTYMDLSSSSSTSSTNSSSNYNLYTMGSNGNMPPTPGISPTANSISPSEQNVKGRPKKRKAGSGQQNGAANVSASGSNNSMENGVAGTTGKKGGKSKQAKSTSAAKMEPSQISESKPSLENSVNSVIQQQQQQQANSSRVLSSGMLGSNGEDSPDDFKHNFDNNLDYFSDNNEDDGDDDLLDTSSSNNGLTNDSISSSIAAVSNGTDSCTYGHQQPNGSNGNYYDSVAAVAAAAAAAAAAAQRQKRMRTSFKHHQLRIMKNYFEMNHNPDAKDLKNLSQKTGLSKRVLQVWFQNARAKFRRGHGHNGSMDGSLDGTGGGGGGQLMGQHQQQQVQQQLSPGGQLNTVSSSNTSNNTSLNTTANTSIPSSSSSSSSSSASSTSSSIDTSVNPHLHSSSLLPHHLGLDMNEESEFNAGFGIYHSNHHHHHHQHHHMMPSSAGGGFTSIHYQANTNQLTPLTTSNASQLQTLSSHQQQQTGSSVDFSTNSLIVDSLLI